MSRWVGRRVSQVPQNLGNVEIQRQHGVVDHVVNGVAWIRWDSGAPMNVVLVSVLDAATPGVERQVGCLRVEA